MESKKILTRDNILTDELCAPVERIYKGIILVYNEVYYLDFFVDEDTGIVDTNKKVKYYTKSQMDRNLKALKNEYHIARGSASPLEIISFRNKYNIPASTFSVILGFSKNTISNIENEGITSLSSGRLIKMCLEDKNLVNKYVQMCDSIEMSKKKEILRRLKENN